MINENTVNKHREFDAVIFDLDGVICSTDEYHFQAWKALSDSVGIYFDSSINDLLRGVSQMESLNLILQRCKREFSEEERLVLAEKKNCIYQELLKKMTTADLTDDVKKTLETLRSRGYCLAIGSSSKNARLILGQIGLNTFFDAVSDGTLIKRSKPDPEVFLLASQMLHVPAKRCLVVEDAVSGAEAAHRGGMKAACVGAAAAAGAGDYCLSKVSDLLKIL